jgi:hypothetical protein
MDVTGTKPTLLTIGPSYALAQWRNVLLGLWRDTPTIPAVEDIGRHYRRVMGKSHNAFGIITIIEARTPLPDLETRKVMVSLMSDTARSVACMAGVTEATGLKNATVRSVLTALSLAARAHHPTKIFSGLEEASVWIAEEAGRNQKPPLLSKDLTNAILTFRRAIQGCTAAHEVRL